MFNPPAHRLSDPDEMFDLVERAGFGHLVSHGGNGFDATGLPFLVDRGSSSDSSGSLRAHFARANNQWKQIDGTSVLVLVPLLDGYVSPAWYPSKAKHGKVVPTWNYEVVHVHGKAQIHDDTEWVRQLVTDLTNHHEASRAAVDGEPEWAVTDAPPEFVDGQLRGIVGIEVEISLIEAKRKLSQNRPGDDQAGVVAGLQRSATATDRALGETMASLEK